MPLPPSVRFELEGFCKSNAQKNLLLAAELLRLLRSFNENEVPVVTSKDPILAEAVYGGFVFGRVLRPRPADTRDGPCQSRRHSAGLRVHGSVSR